MLRAVPATLAHAADLLPTLRPEDRREITSSSGLTAEASLARAVAVSERAWAALDDEDRVVLIFGVARMSKVVGSPWMLASTKINAHARQIARLTRPLVDALQVDFPILVNAADCRNTLHLRWLRWAGFTFTRITRSHDGSPFVEFIRIKNPCATPPH